MLLVSAVLLLVIWMPALGCEVCSPRQRWLATGLVLGLLALDRLDSLLFGEGRPRPWVALGLLALRFVLIEAVARVSGITLGAWMYLLLPPVAARYSGAAGAIACGAAIWVITAPRLLLDLEVRGYDRMDLPPWPPPWCWRRGPGACGPRAWWPS
jgi:hypothetical protein